MSHLKWDIQNYSGLEHGLQPTVRIRIANTNQVRNRKVLRSSTIYSNCFTNQGGPCSGLHDNASLGRGRQECRLQSGPSSSKFPHCVSHSLSLTTITWSVKILNEWYISFALLSQFLRVSTLGTGEPGKNSDHNVNYFLHNVNCSKLLTRKLAAALSI